MTVGHDDPFARALDDQAARIDRNGGLPSRGIELLRAEGVLTAPLPPTLGGRGLGTTKTGAIALLALLRRIGRGDLSMGRLFEGHVNAIRLVTRYGTQAQQRRMADDVLSGHLIALWVTDDVPVQLHRDGDGWVLRGQKSFCSGVGLASRALITVQPEDGPPRMALLPVRRAPVANASADLPGSSLDTPTLTSPSHAASTTPGGPIASPMTAGLDTTDTLHHDHLAVPLDDTHLTGSPHAAPATVRQHGAATAHPDAALDLAAPSTTPGPSPSMAGMRGAATARYDLSSTSIDDTALVGAPGDYLRQPDFSAGAWRGSAVALGGIDRLVDALRDQLSARGRAGSPHQLHRIGEALIHRETAALWCRRAALLAESDAFAAGDVQATVNLARIACEQAGLAVITLVQRSLGLQAFLRTNPVERVMRDLATYLRQPAPDETLTEAAAWFTDHDLPDPEPSR